MFNTYSSTYVMHIGTLCSYLFMDVSDHLYCSFFERSVVRRISLHGRMEMVVVVGIDDQGSDSNELSYPTGIFVDTNFDLYVADFANHRI